MVNPLKCLHIFDCVGIGFKYQWTISYQVADILQGGPAHQILQVGDKITKVSSHTHTYVHTCMHMSYHIVNDIMSINCHWLILLNSFEVFFSVIKVDVLCMFL